VCTAIYIRKYLGINNHLAALSPCIAKSDEFNDTGLVQYNVTFVKLLEFLKKNNIKLPKEETEFDRVDGDIVTSHPLPGGMKKNIDSVIGEKHYIVNAEGFDIYEKLNTYTDISEELIPDIFDVHNCINGCSAGSACFKEQNLFEINKLKSESIKNETEKYSQTIIDSVFKAYDDKLDITHFKREYKPVTINIPSITDIDIKDAFKLLQKSDYDSHHVDCGACGSETCYDFARRIAHKVSIPENCVAKSTENVKEEKENYVIANQQLRKAIDVANEASETKSKFLASMSHEIIASFMRFSS
jgi:hypothetical protein